MDSELLLQDGRRPAKPSDVKSRGPRSLQSFAAASSAFFEMIKFEHSVFALPFAYLGLLLSVNGWPHPVTLIWVTVAMVSCRTLGMSLNRLIDLPMDALNPRTSARALPAGRLKISFVSAAALVSFLIFEFAAFQLAPLCFRLSPIPVFLMVLYPFLKRFTWFSHLVLGIILGIAPYAAWIAGRGSFSWIPALFSLGVMTWVCGFDMIYALQDIDFDRKYGFYSFPARFSAQRTLAVTKGLHALTVMAWFAGGWLAGLGPIYYMGMGLIALFLIREHWLIHSAGLKKINEAFFTMNAVVSLTVFAAAVLDITRTQGTG